VEDGSGVCSFALSVTCFCSPARRAQPLAFRLGHDVTCNISHLVVTGQPDILVMGSLRRSLGAICISNPFRTRPSNPCILAANVDRRRQSACEGCWARTQCSRTRAATHVSKSSTSRPYSCGGTHRECAWSGCLFDVYTRHPGIRNYQPQPRGFSKRSYHLAG
jgi:hypothetical protein